MSGVNAAEYLDGVSGNADAVFPVACVQPLPCVDKIPHHGVVIIGGCSFGELDTGVTAAASARE